MYVYIRLGALHAGIDPARLQVAFVDRRLHDVENGYPAAVDHFVTRVIARVLAVVTGLEGVLLDDTAEKEVKRRSG